MNSILVASQVAWPLQAVIALTFAVSLIGLAWQLQRPAARGFAMGWSWTTFSLLVTSASSLMTNPAGRLPGGLTTALICTGVGGSVPCFAAAIDALVDGRRVHTLRTAFLRSLMWAGALFTALLLTGMLGAGPRPIVTILPVTAARVVLLVSYLLLAVHALRARQLAGRRFRAVLLVFALALIIQAMRPLTAVIFFEGAQSSPLANPRAVAFLMVNVFITTAFGLACILVALEEERAAVHAVGRQLRDAALRVERAQRLESVGRLATGVAHDFNNFLMIIKAGAELARDRFTEGHVPDEELHAIDDAADRGVALTRQLLTFARQQPLRVVEFDAVERVRQMKDLLERVVGRQVELTMTLPSSPLWVHMDPSQFEQVVLNLVSNARNAMRDDNGHIAVQLTPQTLTSARLLDVGELEPGTYASLTVRDDGRGIPPDALPRIFEPFFTTRHDDGGTGLGLATVQGIVRQSGGDVSVDSTPGSGSMFTVWLPTEELPPQS